MKPLVIIPKELRTPPSDVELSAATIIGLHFKTSVEFLIPSISYRQTTPDITFLGRLWEIKSPKGASKKNLEKQLKTALKQSRNIIIDCRSCGLKTQDVKKYLQSLLETYRRTEALVIISREQKIIELFKRN